ncbi:carboxylesterase/lipase family protein [Pseudogracilibacillus sp. SO30301A]|uniref:carboxylesterase/lipase family protein n=1 Tax=Pseudogracilibacillus sp. SO30301A TaxID=3098291 RepID=UPI00300E3F9E
MKTAKVSIFEGTYIGKKDNEIISFKGIPYAMPPTGSLRWKAPQSLEKSSNEMDAFHFGSSCIQPVDEIEQSSLATQSEDCLTLNVWTKELSSAKKPVMVFIHGGGYIAGASSDPVYDGENFVKRNDIVLVSINYRVNIFGFLNLEEIGGKEYEDSKYLGTLDQIKALEWVKKNIHLFGGDADNITIFGESCGGGSVSVLMTIPKAKGLFHKVIAQSGTLNLVKNTDISRQIGRDFVELTGASTIEKLLEIDEDQLRIYCDELMEKYEYKSEIIFAPVADGKLIPKNPFESIADGFASDIKLMIGTTKDEIKFWRLYYPNLEEVIDDFLEQQIAIIGRNTYDVDTTIKKFYTSSITTDKHTRVNEILFRIPSIQFAELQSKYNDTWMYLFAWPSQIGKYGACHAIDLPFVFHNLDTEDEQTFIGNNLPEDLAANVQDAWAAFAIHGNPQHLNIPHWPSYDTKERATMIIDEQWDCVNDPYKSERLIFEEIMHLNSSSTV